MFGAVIVPDFPDTLKHGLLTEGEILHIGIRVHLVGELLSEQIRGNGQDATDRERGSEWRLGDRFPERRGSRWQRGARSVSGGDGVRHCARQDITVPARM